MARLRKLTPSEELAYMREIYGHEPHVVFSELIKSFDVLQARSQMLLGLVTICLTITGFSGPQIAASSMWSKMCITYGISLVLISAIIVLLGPLRLRWGTQFRADTLDESLLELIRHRNMRSQRYYTAALTLIVGMSGYVGSLVGYLFQL